jgi:hypothetical protein
LFGSPRDAHERVGAWRKAGIDEVAALVDFGLPDKLVLDHLDYLFELNDLCRRTSTRRAAAAAPEIEIETEDIAHEFRCGRSPRRSGAPTCAA